MSILSILILLLDRVACSVKLVQIGTNKFTVISDQISEDITSDITSFTFDSSNLQTLKVLSNGKFSLSTYDLRTGDNTKSVTLEKKCDQVMVSHTDWLICRA